MKIIQIFPAAVSTVLLCSSGIAQIPIDPYAWLMPIKSEKALAWAKRQTDDATMKLEGSPSFQSVTADIRDVHVRSTALPNYYRVGRRYLRLTTNRVHPYGLVETAIADDDGKPGTWKVAFDLDAFNKTVRRPYSIKWLRPTTECRPPDYDRCMLPLWPNGEQHNEYRELDLNEAKFVEDGFRIGPSRTSLGWLDNDTLVVSHSTGNAPALPSQFPAKLFLWKRGTPLVDAPTIFTASPEDSAFQMSVTTLSGVPHVIVQRVESYAKIQLVEVEPNGSRADLPIPLDLKNFGQPVFTNGKLVVQLSTPATIGGRQYSADSIVSYDLATGKSGVVMSPPPGVYLSGDIEASREGVMFVGTRDMRHLLYSAVPDGNNWKIREVREQPVGMTMNLRGSGENGNGILLLEQGLLTPPRVSIVRPDGTTSLMAAQNPVMDLSAYTVDIRSAKSSDGTPIDYYLMHKKGVAHRPVPTILDGYGGFGAIEEPRYFGYRLGASWKTWYDHGGAFAIAAIRGGGERGGAWHLAGAGVHKKQMFDDFNAVAEAIERSGFTNAKHLGIMGHSNGGMLVSGAETLRPDLYGAVLDGAPLTDVFSIGHGDGSIAAGMKAEMGDNADPKQIPGILAWSPYQNIRTGVRYPPTLAYVASTDTQVGPSHSRKFIARLQDVGAPAMLIEGSDGGHDFPSEYTQTADTAMLMTFLVDTLMKP